MNWPDKIYFLKRLLEQIGGLWPAPSTKLAGYAEDGPYHCKDCIYLKGRTTSAVFRDSDGKGRCSQPVMLADPQVKKDADGKAIVNIERGCCEFVEPPK